MSELTGTHFDADGSVINCIGIDIYAKKFLVRNNVEKRFQILKIPYETDEESINRLINEGKEMKKLPSSVFGGVDEIGGIDRELSPGETQYILMDYIPSITLFDYLEALYNYPNKPHQMDPLIKFKIIYGIAYSMACLHVNGMVHGDIKPSNIFLDHRFHPHLGDFGKILNGRMILGPLSYLPPEAYQPDGVEIPYGPEYDIYQFGATLFHIITYEWPYSDKERDRDILREYISKGILDDRFEPGNIKGNDISDDDKELYQLAKMCMAFNKEQRPTSNQLINWIAEGAQKKLTKQQFNLFAQYGTRLSRCIPENLGTFDKCKIAIEKGFIICSRTLGVIGKELNLENSFERHMEAFHENINKNPIRVPTLPHSPIVKGIG